MEKAMIIKNAESLGLTVIRETRGAVEARRADGMTVFLDGDEQTDFVRLHGSKEAVIVAVALQRARTIALNYAQTHAPETLPTIEKLVGGQLLDCAKIEGGMK